MMRRSLILMVAGLGMAALATALAAPAFALSLSGNYYTLSSTHIDTLGGIDGGTVFNLVNVPLSGTPGTVGAAPVYSGVAPPASGVINDTTPSGGPSLNEPIQWWTVHTNVALDTTVGAGGVRADAITGGVLGGGTFASAPGFYSGAAGCNGTSNACGYRAVHWIGTFTVNAPVIVSLTADDDAWLFLNGSRVLDNGGVKAQGAATTTSQALGVGTYTVDLFFADRHRSLSGITFSCQDDPGASGVGSCLDPVPEPATLLLFGTTLAGLGAVVRRRMKREATPEA